MPFDTCKKIYSERQTKLPQGVSRHFLLNKSYLELNDFNYLEDSGRIIILFISIIWKNYFNYLEELFQLFGRIISIIWKSYFD